MCDAHFLDTRFKLVAANAEEKIIDDPTYPKYKIGGCITRAGSWSIGLRPNPSIGTG